MIRILTQWINDSKYVYELIECMLIENQFCESVSKIKAIKSKAYFKQWK
jgi:hypothetical protein